MKIERAKKMGFCFGVRRAIEVMERGAKEHGGVESLGAVVHNHRVVDQLVQLGVHAVPRLEELEGPVVAISSHGVSPEVVESMHQRGFHILDATCPVVRRAQHASRALAEAGFWVVVFGDEGHPEVQGVLGWAQGKGVAALDAEKLSLPGLPSKLGILCQTTQSPELYIRFVQGVTSTLPMRFAELRVMNTICRATIERQTAALDLARRVELLLVVGSSNSANTRRLVEICSPAVETHLVETVDSIDLAWLNGHSRLGVTAGASTPDEVIDEVVKRLESIA